MPGRATHRRALTAPITTGSRFWSPARCKTMEPIDVETLDPAEDGAACAVRGYAFPLPEAAQDLDALCLDIAPYRGVS